MTCIKNMFGNQSQMKSQTSRMMERTRRPLSEIEARGSDPSVYVLLYMLEGGAAVACVVRGFVKIRRLAYPPLAWEQLVISG